jgi:hypothetical protein
MANCFFSAYISPTDYESDDGGPSVIYPKLCISESWKTVSDMKVCISESWKTVSDIKICIGESWKSLV